MSKKVERKLAKKIEELSLREEACWVIATEKQESIKIGELFNKKNKES